MYLLGKRADQISTDDILRLVENKVAENKSLDYKRELKLSLDKDKKEFLFDITSMSNTDGGCLIYGIAESKDENGRNTGTPEAIVGIEVENFDKLAQQMEDFIKANTDPNISSIVLNHLIVGVKNILVIGITKTLGLPTMVTFNDTNKFYRRRNSGKYSVDVYELNQMFMQNQILKESAENFKHQRIEKVRTLKVLPNLNTTSSFFIHIIPFGFLNEQILDLTNAEQMVSTLMRPMFSIRSGWDTMFNVDGFATWSHDQNSQIISYDQLFRNGIYEVYSSNLFGPRNLVDGRTIKCMYGQPFIPEVLKKITTILEILKKYQIEPPFIISLSIVGMKGAVIYSTESWGKGFLVDEIYLPPIVVPTFETDIYNCLRPIFDIIWQSVAENKSPTYNM